MRVRVCLSLLCCLKSVCLEMCSQVFVFRVVLLLDLRKVNFENAICIVKYYFEEIIVINVFLNNLSLFHFVTSVLISSEK